MTFVKDRKLRSLNEPDVTDGCMISHATSLCKIRPVALVVALDQQIIEKWRSPFSPSHTSLLFSSSNGILADAS